MADNVGSLAPSKSTDNVGVVLSNDNDVDYEETDSVHDGDIKTCKFCYGTESDGSEWLHPCNYSYKKHLVLLPPSEWRLPNVKITALQFFEIALDFYSTTRLYKGFVNAFSGKRTIIMQLAHMLFYRMFILTASRVEYYESIGRQLLKSICHQTVANYGEEESDKSLFSMSKGFSREIEDLVRF